eukprot:Rmarinus@m.24593
MAGASISLDAFSKTAIEGSDLSSRAGAGLWHKAEDILNRVDFLPAVSVSVAAALAGSLLWQRFRSPRRLTRPDSPPVSSPANSVAPVLPIKSDSVRICNESERGPVTAGSTTASALNSDISVSERAISPPRIRITPMADGDSPSLPRPVPARRGRLSPRSFENQTCDQTVEDSQHNRGRKQKEMLCSRCRQRCVVGRGGTGSRGDNGIDGRSRNHSVVPCPSRTRRNSMSVRGDPDDDERLQHAKRIEQAFAALEKLRDDGVEGVDFLLEVFQENAATACAALTAQVLNQLTLDDTDTLSWIETNYAPHLSRIIDYSEHKLKKPPVQQPNARRKTIFPTGVSLPSKRQQELLENAENWSFNIFEFWEATKGKMFFVLLSHILRYHHVFDYFDFNQKKLEKFCDTLQSSYCGSKLGNRYHNAIHAADVLQTAHFLASACGLGRYLTRLDLAALFVAALVHDYRHPGLNNAFLIKTRDELAVRYNDHSVLENYHVASAFQLLHGKEFNFLESLTDTQALEFREAVIRMVLATDMARHFDAVAVIRVKQITSLAPLPEDTIDHVAVQAFASEPVASDTFLSTHKREDRLFLLETALHWADLSNPAKPQSLSGEWANRVTEEFYAQGDRERKHNFPVSTFFDREKPLKEKCQVSFIEFIVLPYFNEVVRILPKTSQCVDTLKCNLAVWKKREFQTRPDSPSLEDAAAGKTSKP